MTADRDWLEIDEHEGIQLLDSCACPEANERKAADLVRHGDGEEIRSALLN